MENGYIRQGGIFERTRKLERIPCSRLRRYSRIVFEIGRLKAERDSNGAKRFSAGILGGRSATHLFARRIDLRINEEKRAVAVHGQEGCMRRWIIHCLRSNLACPRVWKRGMKKGTARSLAKERTSKGKEKKAGRKDRKEEKRMRFILPGTIGQRRKSLLNWQKLSKVLYQAAGAVLDFVYSRSLANSEPQWAASFAYKSTSRWMLRSMIQTRGFLPRGMGIKSKIASVSYHARYASIKYCWRVESANHSFLRPLFRLIKPSLQSSTSPIQAFFRRFRYFTPCWMNVFRVTSHMHDEFSFSWNSDERASLVILCEFCPRFITTRVTRDLFRIIIPVSEIYGEREFRKSFARNFAEHASSISSAGSKLPSAMISRGRKNSPNYMKAGSHCFSLR